MDKSDVRVQLLKQRSNLTNDECRQRSKSIAARLQSAIDWSTITRLHVYRSRDDLNEADTGWILSYTAANWPDISVTVGSANAAAPLPTEQFDAVVVPIIAFDEHLNRLGFGGGWYDRFLATQPNALIIGLAYDFQRIDRLPTEPHDIPMMVIVTDLAVYR